MRKILSLMLTLVSLNCFAGVPVVMQDKPVAVVSPKETLFIVKLKSNPTTGYSWFLKDYNHDLLMPVKHEFVAPENKKMAGAPGFEMWTFKAKPAAFTVPQETMIQFIYMRPWEHAAGDSTEVVFKVVSTK